MNIYRLYIQYIIYIYYIYVYICIYMYIYYIYNISCILYINYIYTRMYNVVHIIFILAYYSQRHYDKGLCLFGGLQERRLLRDQYHHPLSLINLPTHTIIHIPTQDAF